jgi:hypothetical protein
VGGMFYLLIDLSGEDPNMPIHYDVNIEDIHNALTEIGLVCAYGKNNFASVWTR